MSQQHTAAAETLASKAKQIFLSVLTDGAERTTADLKALIPDDLAEARCRLTHPIVYQDMPDKKDYGRLVLTRDAIELIKAEGLCEVREVNGLEEIRLGQQQEDATKMTADHSHTDATVPARYPQPDEQFEIRVQFVGPDMPVHPVAQLFPTPTKAEYAALKKDIRVNGQQVPAWMYHGQLIDGRSRAQVCKEVGRKLAVREWSGHGSLVTFVASLNLHRRHLSESQRAMVGARIKEQLAVEAKQRMLAGKAPDPMANLPQGAARDQAARMVGVSPRSIDAASKVLKAAPELVRAVEADQVSVSAAATLADLPTGEQAKVVAKGKKAAAAKAKEIRVKEGEQQKDAIADIGIAPRQARKKGSISLPVGKPKFMAKLLLKYLGRVKACKLVVALNELLRPQSVPSTVVGGK